MKTTRIAVMAAALLMGGSMMVSTASADRILIDLGKPGRVADGQYDSYNSTDPNSISTNGELYWNHVPALDATLSDLIVASNGTSSGIGMAITAPFSGDRQETFGLDSSLDSYQYTPGAFTDSMWTLGDTDAQIVFSGLDASGATTYSFTFYAHRNTDVVAGRFAQYDVTGGNGTSSVILDSVGNISNVVTVSDMIATADGTITLDVGRTANSTSDYAYLSLIDINTATNPIPEPATMTLLGLGGLAMMRRRRTH